MIDEIGSHQTKFEGSSKFAYVGSYTHQFNGQGNGLHVFRIDPVSGSWANVQLLKDVVDSSFLAIDNQKRFLYCVHESLGEVSAFSINQKTGLLEFLNAQPTGGEGPTYLCLDPTNRFLIVANYYSGSIAVLPIAQSGKLEPVSQLTIWDGQAGPDKVEQTSSHPHDIQFAPDGRFLMVPDKGFDKISIFKFDPADGKLVPNEPPFTFIQTGAGPRHLAFHPNGLYAYLLNELNSTLTFLE